MKAIWGSEVNFRAGLWIGWSGMKIFLTRNFPPPSDDSFLFMQPRIPQTIPVTNWSTFKSVSVSVKCNLALCSKSLSEALLFAEQGENMLCTKILLNVRNNFCTKHVLPWFELGIFMYWSCNSMNTLLSYCGLVNAKILTKIYL